jgi:hypothetical protein
METITINECLFNVVVERDQSLVPHPVHFLYYKDQRVGLYVVTGDMDTIYFDSVTMFELFGQDFNKDNFPVGITFGRFDKTGLTLDQYNKQQNETNLLLARGHDIFQEFLYKDYYRKNNIK